MFKKYRREYKKRFAWIKVGKILAEDYYTWGERAGEQLAEIEMGI